MRKLIFLVILSLLMVSNVYAEQDIYDKYGNLLYTDYGEGEGEVTPFKDAEVNHSYECGEVQSQGNSNTCTAMALNYLKRYQEYKEWHKLNINFSASFIYNSRVIAYPEDIGMTVEEGLDLLKNTGVVTEDLMPYNWTDPVTRPTEVQKHSARFFKIRDYRQYDLIDYTDISKATSYLKDNIGIMSIPVDLPFQTLKDSDQIPTYSKIGDKVGNHAVAVVGYDTKKQSLLILNSYSNDWGFFGLCYIPYKFLLDNKITFYEVSDATFNNGIVGKKIKDKAPDWERRIFVNGRELNLDVKSETVNGRTMIPLRSVAEAFGSKVVWNDKNKSVDIYKNNIEMKLVVGSKEAEIYPYIVGLDAPVYISNNRVMVPLRFIAEAFGADVTYINFANIIDITD